MTADRRRFMVSLSAADFARLEGLAGAAGMPLPKFAATQLERLVGGANGVEAHGEKPATEAEKRLFEWLNGYLATLTSWDERVILRVFQEIEQSQRALYDEASADGGAQRLNRLLGAAIRYQLDALPKMKGTIRLQRHVRKNEAALIQSYTLLQPRTD